MVNAYVTCGVCGRRRFVYRNDLTPVGAKIYCPTCKKMILPSHERRTDGETMEKPLKTKAPLHYRKPKPKRGPAKPSKDVARRAQTRLIPDHVTEELRPVPIPDVIPYPPSKELVIDRVCAECHHARVMHRRHSFGWICKECPCEIIDSVEVQTRREDNKNGGGE